VRVTTSPTTSRSWCASPIAARSSATASSISRWPRPRRPASIAWESRRYAWRPTRHPYIRCRSGRQMVRADRRIPGRGGRHQAEEQPHPPLLDGQGDRVRRAHRPTGCASTRKTLTRQQPARSRRASTSPSPARCPTSSASTSSLAARLHRGWHTHRFYLHLRKVVPHPSLFSSEGWVYLQPLPHRKISPNFPAKSRVKPLNTAKSPQPTENKREKTFRKWHSSYAPSCKIEVVEKTREPRQRAGVFHARNRSQEETIYFLLIAINSLESNLCMLKLTSLWFQRL